MRQLQKAIPQWVYFVVPSIILVIATVIVYFPTLHYEFQFDDLANIQKHFAIRHNTFFSLFFSGTRWISYWLNSLYYAIDKFNPYYYRIGNLIIHCLNGLLVFLTLLLGISHLTVNNFFKRNAFSLSFITALLFLLHPVQTQTVSYVIQGQLEGMAVCAILLMSFSFLVASYSKIDFVRYLFNILLFVFAFLSIGTKEVAIVSPLLIVFLDWFFVAQGDWKSLKGRWMLHGVVFAIVGVGYVYLMRPAFFFEVFGFQKHVKNNIGNVITDKPEGLITPAAYCISQFKVILHYFWIFIWPFSISVEYDWKLSSSLLAPDCLFPLIALCMMGFFLYKLWKKDNRNLIIFAVVWFFIIILPRSSIVPSQELMFDYKTYGSSIGVFFLIACACMWISLWVRERISALKDPRYAQVVGFSLIVMIAAGLGFSSYNRNKVWSSGLLFWGDILKKAPGKARAYNNYGVELSTKLKEFEKSVPYFKKAIAMDHLYPDPCNNLAVAYANLNKVDEAISAIKQGLKINPYYPEGYNNLSSFLLIKNDPEQSIIASDRAIKLRPHYGKAWLNKGRALLELGRDQEALECFRNCCTKGDLDNEFGFSSYAQIAMKVQAYDDAIKAYQCLKQINPRFQDVDFNLANAYFLSGQSDKAISIYKRLLEGNPSDFRIRYNLGEAYLKRDDYKQALDCFNQVQAYSHIFPRVGLRIAQCYDKLGNQEESKKALVKVVENNRLPQDVKKMAQALLDQFDHKEAITA